MVSRRKSSYYTRSLEKLDGRVLTYPKDIIVEIILFFQNLYTEKNSSRPLIDVLDWCSIPLDKAQLMMRQIKEKEICIVVIRFDADKAPSLDGFNVVFY